MSVDSDLMPVVYELPDCMPLGPNAKIFFNTVENRVEVYPEIGGWFSFQVDIPYPLVKADLAPFSG